MSYAVDHLPYVVDNCHEWLTIFPMLLNMCPMLLVLRRLARSSSNADLAVELHDRLEELMNDLPGVQFTCSMLVDVTCDTPCDWNHFRTNRHDLSAGGALDYRTLFVADAMVDSSAVQVAEQVRHSFF